jgi:hypothetical protein
VTRTITALTSFSADELAEIHRHIQERLGIDTQVDPDPLIDLPRIAKLAGLAPGTPGQQRQRSLAGKSRERFPDPDPIAGSRFEDKPMWKAVTDVVPYLMRTGNWPPEAGARHQTRGGKSDAPPPERYSFRQLAEVAPLLHNKLYRSKAGTSGLRTLERWRQAAERYAEAA